MRRAVLASLLILPIAASSAAAQTAASAEAPVRAVVAPRPIFMAATGETNFGIVAGADVTNATGTAVLNPTALTAGQSTAMFTASGEPNTNVVVTCRGSLILFHSNGSHAMRFEPAVSASHDAGNPAAGMLCNGAAGSFPSALNGNGELYMWLGGYLFVHSHNPPTAGMYRGIYTLSISY